MVQVEFASSITRHTLASSFKASGGTVGEVLADVFRQLPALRTYVVDDQGAIRKHVTVFINDTTIRDRDCLTDTVTSSDCVYVY